MSGLSYIGSNCFDTALVIGYKRVPFPPAKTIPFKPFALLHLLVQRPVRSRFACYVLSEIPMSLPGLRQPVRFCSIGLVFLFRNRVSVSNGTSGVGVSPSHTLTPPSFLMLSLTNLPNASFQCGRGVKPLSTNRFEDNLEFRGRSARVGYCEDVTGTTSVVNPSDSTIASANSYQLQ